jgi:hypothetical protein
VVSRRRAEHQGEGGLGGAWGEVNPSLAQYILMILSYININLFFEASNNQIFFELLR